MPEILNTKDGHKLIMDICPMCRTAHAFNESVYAAAMSRREAFEVYCPNGHKWHYKTVEELNEDAKVRRERDQLKTKLYEKSCRLIQLTTECDNLQLKLDACRKLHRNKAAAARRGKKKPK